MQYSELIAFAIADIDRDFKQSVIAAKRDALSNINSIYLLDTASASHIRYYVQLP